MAPASVLALLTLAGPALAQWTSESPVPTFLDVRGVAATGPDHVFLATSDDQFDDGGSLWESTDGGESWIPRDVPFSLGSPLNGLFFLDDSTGWAYGNEQLRTEDGGATWTELPLLGSIYFMEFYTPDLGIASGGSFQMLTRDGGDSWDPSPHDIRRLSFADDLIAIGVADSALHRTTDGATSFTEVISGVARSAVFLSSTVAVAIVDDELLRSTDAGATWSPVDDAEGRTRLTAVTADVVLAWGRGGSWPDLDDRVFRSDDGGQTWTDLGEVAPDGVLTMTPVTADVVIAADLAGGIFRSGDGGATWTRTFVSPGPTPGFIGTPTPFFVDASVGYYGFGPGFVLATDDGGQTWSQISSGTGTTLTALDRFPDGDLIAVGEMGTLLTRDVAGTRWVLAPRPVAADLEAVHVIGADEAVIATATGQVLLTTDGGATWTPTPTDPPVPSPTDVHFTSLTDGWVVGSGSEPVLAHTTDGGATWTPVTGFAGAYRSVDIEGMNGWVLNSSGRYQRTTDGGDTWIEDDLPGPGNMRDMDFFDENVGYAVGWFGQAFRSADGGASWSPLPVPDPDVNFTDLYLLGPDELWVSTTDDLAYYSASGGTTWAPLPIPTAAFGSHAGIVATPEGDAWVAGFLGSIERFDGPPPPPDNQPPSASFEWEAFGLTADFTDTSTDLDGEIVAWAWDFGDSTFAAEQHPSHTYVAEDTYIVRLTVTDDDGDTDDTIRIVTVTDLPGGVFGDFTEVTPLDPLFVTPSDEDWWVTTTAPADYDGDGDLDVAVLGFYVVYGVSAEDRLVLFRNDGPAGEDEWDFSYVDVPLGDLSAGASDMAWGDVDDDGDQDLVVGSNGLTVLYRNDDGTLVQTDTVLPGYHEDNDQADFDLSSISWADSDNDGDLDLLLPSVWDGETFSYRTKLMRNDGPDGSGGFLFTETDSMFAPTRHAQSQWADYDGDADLDLLLVHLAPLTDQGFIRVYRNEGDGVFTPEDVLGELTMEHGEAEWGDHDGDGDLDILAAGHIKEIGGGFVQEVRIYRNEGDGTHTPIEVVCDHCDGWLDITAGSWADYDSDGDVDILVAGSYNSGSQIDGRARVFVNDGGTFVDSGSELPAPRASGTRGGAFSWLDLDLDGDLDYLIAGQYFVPGGGGLVEAQMHVYRNDTEAENRAPEPPGDLVASVDDVTGTVSFGWSPGADDRTPEAALTYELEVYRNGAPVGLPRRLPEPGGVSAVTSWVLSDLPEGIYAWTLQTVDSAFNGSPLAEGSFQVGEAVDVGDATGAPLVYGFQQNRPNPFNPATTFRFTLPAVEHVRLTVYDAMGRRVATVLDGPREAGRHALRWQADGLASGTYFARIEAGSFERVRRIQLLK